MIEGTNTAPEDTAAEPLSLNKMWAAMLDAILPIAGGGHWHVSDYVELKDDTAYYEIAPQQIFNGLLPAERMRITSPKMAQAILRLAKDRP